MLFDTACPEWQPLYNPVSNLVYSATGNSVSDVFVAGDRVVEDGHLTMIDEAEVLDLVARSTLSFDERLDLQKLVKLQWPVT